MENYDIAREKFHVMIVEILGKGANTEKVLKSFDYVLKDYNLETKETGLVVYDGNATEQLIEYYLRAMGTGKFRDKTSNERRRTLKRFFRIIGKSPTDVQHQDIYTYKYVLMENGTKANSINSYLVAVSAFYKWCVKRGIVKESPIDSEDKSRVMPTEKLPLSDVEIQKLRDTIKDNLLYSTLVEFMLSTGLRREEVIKARKQDICYDRMDANGNVPILVPDGKGGKGRFTFISKKAMEKLNEYFAKRTDEDEHIFVSRYKIPFSESGIEYIFKTMKKKSGIAKLTPHTLRRTFATNSVQSGVSINAVARVMGHASIDTTMVYAKDTMETLLTQFEKAM